MKKLLICCMLFGGGFWAYFHQGEARVIAGRISRLLGAQLVTISQYLVPKRAQQPSLELSSELPEAIHMARRTIPANVVLGTPQIAEGTELLKVGETQGKLLLRKGNTQFVVDETLVTRDPKEVGAIRHRVLRRNLSLLAQTRTKLDAELLQVTADIRSTIKELDITRHMEAISKFRGKALSMGTTSDFLQTRLDRLEAKASELRGQIAAATPSPQLEYSISSSAP